MCCRGFYRRNSGLGFGDRSLGLGGLRRCCRRSGRFGSRRFLRSSGLRELYRRLFRYSREDFRRRGSRCIRCFRIACRIAVRYVDALFLHTELDGINIFSRVIAEFLCRNRPYRDRGDGYSLRSGQVFDDRAVAADENFFELSDGLVSVKREGFPAAGEFAAVDAAQGEQRVGEAHHFVRFEFGRLDPFEVDHRQPLARRKGRVVAGHFEIQFCQPSDGLAAVDPLREAYLHFGLVAQYVGHLIQRGVLIRIEGELQRIDLDAVEIVASARQEREGCRHDFQQNVAQRLHHDLAVGEFRGVEVAFHRQVDLDVSFAVFENVKSQLERNLEFRLQVLAFLVDLALKYVEVVRAVEKTVSDDVLAAEREVAARERVGREMFAVGGEILEVDVDRATMRLWLSRF